MKDQRSCKCATGYYGDRCDKGIQINQQYKSNRLLQFLSRPVFIYWLYIHWYFKWRLATLWETELPARLEYSVSDDCIYRCRNNSRVRRELHRSQSPGGVLQLLQGKVGVPALAKREVSCERNDHWWQEVLLLPDIQGGLQPLRGKTIRGATEELVQSVFMHVVGLHFLTIWYFFVFSILSRPCRKISLTLNIHWNCHRTLKSSIISSEIQASAWSIAALFRTPGRSAWIFRLYPFPSKSFWRCLTQLIWSLCSAPAAPVHPIFIAVFCFSGEVSPI